MTLKIDPSSISSSVSKLIQAEHQARSASQIGLKSSLLSAFSPVSGLDQLGSGHGSVINGGAGAANSVLNSYAEQIEWLSAALQASGAALTGQDELFARGMDVADTGGRVVEESVMFPARPPLRSGVHVARAKSRRSCTKSQRVHGLGALPTLQQRRAHR